MTTFAYLQKSDDRQVSVPVELTLVSSLRRFLASCLVCLWITPVFAARPPSVKGVQWVEVGYEDIERDLLDQFANDLPRLAELAPQVAVFSVRAKGGLPQGYYRVLRGRIERTLLASPKIVVKDCARCDAGVIESAADGELLYFPVTEDVDYRRKVARDIGTDHLLFVEQNYHPTELRLNVRLINAQSGAVEWTKEYTSMRIAEKLNKASEDKPGGASLATRERAVIGEIAFRATLMAGFGYFPTIDTGQGSELMAYPSLGVSLGERFDNGYKEFGFGLGLAFDMSEGEGAKIGKPAPFFLQMGPHFKYVFNPYNVTSARWIATFEFGAIISQGITTAYLGAGPEIRMVNRFSIGLMPALILNAKVKTPEFKVKDETGREIPIDTGADDGSKFGGLALMFRANMNW